MQEQKHWVEDLQSGDRLLVTIRHKTDGRYNRHNLEAIYISHSVVTRKVKVFLEGEAVKVPFDDTKEVQNIPQQ